ncbi:MAG: hypothetical protein O7G85_05070 [Planctomycetota bacterium]|nr:hypothetical protein [Planctomycetota bacterium]
MAERTERELEMITRLVAGALGGFGESVGSGKVSPEKAAHKAVVMAESAFSEMLGQSSGNITEQKMMVYEKPDR